jgi:hypothetical protein
MDVSTLGQIADLCGERGRRCEHKVQGAHPVTPRSGEMMGGITEDDGWRRLTIKLEGPPSEPSGWVSRNEGARMPFDDWLQLLAALEHVIGAEEQGAKRLG